jgi:virginiamycin A acetyltransferase
MLLQRVYRQLNSRSKTDLSRKIFYYLSQKKNWLIYPFRRIRSWVYFKNPGVRIGKGVLLKGLSYNIFTGWGIEIYDYSIIEMVGDAATLSIGHNCLLSYGVLLSCRENINIGSHVMIGEYTSIRDTSHTHKDRARPMKECPDISSPIVIGDDVWIGRGCIILGGTVIEQGVVVAANSVVKGHLEKYSIYGGIPAHFIKQRNP